MLFLFSLFFPFFFRFVCYGFCLSHGHSYMVNAENYVTFTSLDGIMFSEIIRIKLVGQKAFLVLLCPTRSMSKFWKNNFCFGLFWFFFWCFVEKHLAIVAWMCIIKQIIYTFWQPIISKIKALSTMWMLQPLWFLSVFVHSKWLLYYLLLTAFFPSFSYEPIFECAKCAKVINYRCLPSIFGCV